jgi:hypothetical protein
VALAMVPSIGFLRGEKFQPVHAFYTIITSRYANACAKKTFTTFAVNVIADSRASTNPHSPQPASTLARVRRELLAWKKHN